MTPSPNSQPAAGRPDELVGRVPGHPANTGRKTRNADEPPDAPTSVELPGAILRIGGWVAAIGVSLQCAADLVGFVWFDRTVGQLNADAELTIWSWASSTATACAALAAGLLAVAVRRQWRTYLFLVATLAFFSADDMLQIHERLRADLGSVREVSRVLWPAVYLPLLIASFLLLWYRAAPASEPATRTIRRGLLLLVVAIGCEVASFGMVQIGLDAGTFAYELEVIVEEGLELAAWIFVASGLIAAFVDRAVRLERG